MRCENCVKTRSDERPGRDRKSTRLNSSHDQISYAVFCLKKKKNVYAALSPGEQQPALLEILPDHTREAAARLIGGKPVGDQCPRLARVAGSVDIQRVISL